VWVSIRAAVWSVHALARKDHIPFPFAVISARGLARCAGAHVGTREAVR